MQRVLQKFNDLRSSFSSKRRYSILVIGQTGSGKTSLLELFMNFDLLTQEPLTEETIRGLRRFRDESLENQAGGAMASRTTGASQYLVRMAGMEFIFIDTPGFGDTRGLEEDERHVQRIIARLRASRSISCVLLVINGRESRMTSTLKYVLAEICSIMPRTVLNNCHAIFTNTERACQLTFDVGQLEELGFPCTGYVCIDNPLCLIEKTLQDSPADIQEFLEDELLPVVVKACTKSLAKMFASIEQYPEVLSTEFLELYRKRQSIEALMANLLEKYDNCAEQQQRIRELQNLLEGARPEPHSIVTVVNELVEAENDVLTCPKCKTNCQENLSQEDVPFWLRRPRLCALSRTVGLGCLSVYVKATACAAVEVYGEVGVVAAAPGVFAVIGTGSLGVAALTRASGLAEQCHCKCFISKHEVGRFKWAQHEVHRDVITEEQLARAHDDAERRRVAIAQMEQNMVELEDEKKALTVQLGQTIDQFQEMGMLGSFERMLKVQIGVVEERLQVYGDDDVLRGVLSDIKQRLPVVEEALDWRCCICTERPKLLRFNCGHQVCNECGPLVSNCPLCRTEISERVPIQPAIFAESDPRGHASASSSSA